jgi:hypothetical protein
MKTPEQETNTVPKTQKSTPQQFLIGIRIKLFLEEMQGKISYVCTL